MSERLLYGENIVREFPLKTSLITGKALHTLRAVDQVTLSLYGGETLGIVGESGSGKSTLGEVLGDLQRPDGGRVLFHDKDIRKLNPREYRDFRHNVQFIFQDPKGSMNPNYSILQILTEPLLVLRLEEDIRKRNEKAAQLCKAVGLEESVLNKYPGELSGGQCQRIAIARALITDPEIIICDEAVSALDVSVQAQILNLLKELQAKTGVAYLFITHDIGVVHFMADRIMVMRNGKFVEEGETGEVLLHPKEEYTKQLLQASFARRSGQ